MKKRKEREKKKEERGRRKEERGKSQNDGRTGIGEKMGEHKQKNGLPIIHRFYLEIQGKTMPHEKRGKWGKYEKFKIQVITIYFMSAPACVPDSSQGREMRLSTPTIVNIVVPEGLRVAPFRFHFSKCGKSYYLCFCYCQSLCKVRYTSSAQGF